MDKETKEMFDRLQRLNIDMVRSLDHKLQQGHDNLKKIIEGQAQTIRELRERVNIQDSRISRLEHYTGCL